ncbi:MAG: hypothetical protein F6K47_07245 [Symploca sp. SIO2E6]|nr:hypothetical protein [Symploca sp. SIO2E6]
MRIENIAFLIQMSYKEPGFWEWGIGNREWRIGNSSPQLDAPHNGIAIAVKLQIRLKFLMEK